MEAMTELLVYLWGIETDRHWVDSWIQPGLLVYLWGIETRNAHGPDSARSPLLVYLWGIETGSDIASWNM